MSEFNKTLELTGAKNDAELVQYIEDQKTKLQQVEDELFGKTEELISTKLTLENAKKERTTAKTQATKAEKKAAKLEEEKADLSETADRVIGINVGLKTELEEQGVEIAELKEKLNENKENLPKLADLKSKALKIMQQEGVSQVFISLTNQVFLLESQCKNTFGSKYKVASLVDGDKVQLSSPS